MDACCASIFVPCIGGKACVGLGAVCGLGLEGGRPLRGETPIRVVFDDTIGTGGIGVGVGDGVGIGVTTAAGAVAATTLGVSDKLSPETLELLLLNLRRMYLRFLMVG